VIGLSADSVFDGACERREIPLPDEARDALGANLDERMRKFGPLLDDDYLFVRTDGLRLDGRSLYCLTERLFRCDGIDPRAGSMVHLLRCTFAQRTRESALTEIDVQWLHEHTNVVSTKRILRASEG
jgi:site-specific recombinase XerC